LRQPAAGDGAEALPARRRGSGSSSRPDPPPRSRSSGRAQRLIQNDSHNFSRSFKGACQGSLPPLFSRHPGAKPGSIRPRLEPLHGWQGVAIAWRLRGGGGLGPGFRREDEGKFVRSRRVRGKLRPGASCRFVL
jgi:hypothetical protein